MRAKGEIKNMFLETEEGGPCNIITESSAKCFLLKEENRNKIDEPGT